MVMMMRQSNLDVWMFGMTDRSIDNAQDSASEAIHIDMTTNDPAVTKRAHRRTATVIESSRLKRRSQYWNVRLVLPTSVSPVTMYLSTVFGMLPAADWVG